MSKPSQVTPGASNACLTRELAVLIERRMVRSGIWEQAQWEVVDIVTPPAGAGEGAWMRVHQDQACARYLWTGLCLTLYRDSAEAYWYNLMSGQPRLFVVCFGDDDEDDAAAGGMEPMLVTASQDEATAHLESDDEVYSIEMPAELRDWIEHFVVENYVPARREKRKRRDWAREASDAHGGGPGGG